MTKLEKKEQEKNNSENNNKPQNSEQKGNTDTSVKNETPEEKLKVSQEKLLRTMAEMENQRRRFEKEKEDAFDFGGFAFARESLLLIDNLDRAKISISNNEIFKKNNELSKILETFDVVQK